MNLTENLKKLKLQNEKIYKIGKKRKKIKVQNQTKETAKILDLNKIHKIEDKFYKTTLIKCFTQSCYSKFLGWGTQASESPYFLPVILPTLPIFFLNFPFIRVMPF